MVGLVDVALLKVEHLAVLLAILLVVVSSFAATAGAPGEAVTERRDARHEAVPDKSQADGNIGVQKGPKTNPEGSPFSREQGGTNERDACPPESSQTDQRRHGGGGRDGRAGAVADRCRTSRTGRKGWKWWARRRWQRGLAVDGCPWQGLDEKGFGHGVGVPFLSMSARQRPWEAENELQRARTWINDGAVGQRAARERRREMVMVKVSWQTRRPKVGERRLDETRNEKEEKMGVGVGNE